MTLVAFVLVLVNIMFPAFQRPPPMGVPQQQQEPVVAGGVPQQVIELTVEETLVSVLPEVIGKVSHVAAFQLTTPALALSTPYSKA
jgi:hypothetical protein